MELFEHEGSLSHAPLYNYNLFYHYLRDFTSANPILKAYHGATH